MPMNCAVAIVTASATTHAPKSRILKVEEGQVLTDSRSRCSSTARCEKHQNWLAQTRGQTSTAVGAAGSQGFSLGGLFSGADADLRQPGREAEVQSCGVPYTIARFSRLTDSIGGMSYIEFKQGADGSDGDAAPGNLSREDAALVAVRALQFPPRGGEGIVVTVGGAGSGVPPQGEDWTDMFGRLKSSPGVLEA